MHSSTSSSDALFHSKVLIALCALVIVALECGYRYSLKWSGTHRRVERQYADALLARPSTAGAPASALIVGNSLLLDGIDVDRLQQLTASSVRVYPLFLEGTTYLDWYYGLQRLFLRGARPDAVVVGLGLDGFVDSGVRREYAPRMLFDASDVLAVSAEAGLDRTVTSNLLLAHWSAFWDMRHVIRVQVLTRALPRFERLYLTDLWSDLKAKRNAPVGPDGEAIVLARLRRLRETAHAYGVRPFVLVPPTPSSPGAVRQLIRVADDAGVETLMPIDPAAMPPRYFRPDDIHVNEAGAAIFTDALARGLPTKLGERRVARADRPALSRR